MRAHVITVSDRVAAGTATDATGPELVSWLTGLGWTTTAAVIPDGVDAVQAGVAAAIEGGAHLVLTTGGTGITPRDQTPQAVEPLLGIQVPGVIEAIRDAGRAAGAPGAMLSRGVAGVIETASSRVFIATLPGSRGAVADAIAALDPVLNHLMDQLRGEGHEAG